MMMDIPRFGWLRDELGAPAATLFPPARRDRSAGPIRLLSGPPALLRAPA
jgi:hypothetical protein